MEKLIKRCDICGRLDEFDAVADFYECGSCHIRRGQREAAQVLRWAGYVLVALIVAFAAWILV